MNTTRIKNFAPAARKQLMEAVQRKLDYVLTARTPDLVGPLSQQVASLRKQAQTDREGLIERVAYTWFNRLAAIRFMDARGYHPFFARVLTPANAQETQPELLKLVRTGSLPDELKPHADPARLNDLLDGRMPTAIAGADPQGEVYRNLVLAVCRYYHTILPFLFEQLDDETELLLPDDLLTATSVAEGFRTEITDEDCAEEEILGWFYQYYISERKDEVMGRNAAVPKQDIPAVTQLFTPHWIVRYLVENSLGRLWLLNRPQSKLREKMPYYIEGEAETDFLKITKPEDIRLLDPAGGSGHMLTYAFDLLYAIYEEEGYDAPEIPGIILRHNLYGVDICDRAVALAAFALCMKARAKDNRFFRRVVQPHLISLQEIRFAEGELREYIRALNLGELFNQPMLKLMHQFEEAKNFGSLIQPCLDEKGILFARSAIEAKDLGSQLFLRETHAKVLNVLEQAEYLCQRYHVVVANPPYMGFKQLNGALKQLGENEFKEGMRDSFAMFIQRSIRLTQLRGFTAMVTMDSWTYGDDHTELREWVYETTTIVTAAHLGPHAFDSIKGEVVQAIAFILATPANLDFEGTYFRLVDESPSAAKEAALLEGKNLFRAQVRGFLDVPRRILAYHASEHTLEAFAKGKPLRNFAEAFTGLQTGDNPRFIRFWYEVSKTSIQFGLSCREAARRAGSRWFPYVKGSDYRKWYGNNVCILDWRDDGREIRQHPSSTVRNNDYYFRPGLAYNNIANSFSVRMVHEGFIFDQKNSMFFSPSREESVFSLGFLNSPIVTPFLEVLSPKDFNPGSLKIIPVLPEALNGLPVATVVDQLVSISRSDWDNFENSWDFRDLPLLRSGLKGATLATTWQNWKAHCDAAIRRMQELETENNRIFIAAYGLQDELQSEVTEDQITLARADARKDIAALLSYAVGCMFGRYSLDQPGLILADAGDSVKEYLEKVKLPLNKLAFPPDEDGIIPVLDGEWFTDDIVTRFREFLRVTFGEETLTENLAHVETALGKDLRKYFAKEFYKNHISNERAYGYKKRPIYWMFSSPQGGFSALVYLHRYTKDTINTLLNRYLRDYLKKIEARLVHLDHLQVSGDSNREKTAARKEADKLRKTLHECQEWEREVILPLAQQRIELDLDDGVKVNYLKFKGALVTIPGLEKGEDE